MTDLPINYVHYIMVCVLWAVYAVRMQIIINGKCWWRLVITFLINILFCPICIVLAVAYDPDRLKKKDPNDT